VKSINKKRAGIFSRKNILKNGYTLVELTIVIIVIGILASISVVGYGSWRNTLAEKEVKSDLRGAAAAMETSRNFSNGYPLAIPTTFKESDGVKLTYSGGTNKAFCISGESRKISTVKYYIDSTVSKEPISGTCKLQGPTLTTVLTNSTSAKSEWTAVSGATSYKLERSESPSFTSFSTSSLSGTVITSGLTAETTYYFRVKAIVGTEETGYSNVITVKTGTPTWSVALNNLYTTACPGGNCNPNGSAGAFNTNIQASTATRNQGEEFDIFVAYGCNDNPCTGTVTRTITISGSSFQILNPDNGTWGTSIQNVYTNASTSVGGVTTIRVRIPPNSPSASSTITTNLTATSGIYTIGSGSTLKLTKL
jgi:prepilin-type N-terminal cleavage/methylation domain-containing protein